MNLSKAEVRIFRLLLLAMVIAITVLATTRLKVPVAADVNDKVNHGIAFFVLALLLDFSFPASGFGPGKVMALFGYGLAIETVQYFLSYRSFSLLDLGADGIGLIIYGITLPYLRRAPLLRDRWR